MESVQVAGAATKSPNILYRFLHLFTAIYPGETVKAFLLTLNSFLIMFGYYQIKSIRNGLLLAAHPAEIQSYLAIPQALILIFVVKGFSKIASRHPRHLLITYVTLFCISNLILFNIMNWAGVSVSVMGIIFFIWIGMYNLLIPAQFWGFANDIYGEDAGKRLFPMIAFGASLGGVLGPPVARTLVPHFGSYGMMMVTSAILCLCILMTWIIHKRDLREEREFLSSADGAESSKSKIKEEPLDKSGGFRLIFKSRYLLLIAVVIGLYNFVNALGELMFAKIQQQVAIRTFGTAANGSVDLQNYISQAFAGYQGLANILGLIIQLFLVSRIFRHVGIGGALLFLPLIALGGYGYATFGASLLLMKWVKSVENGTDYSLMKTARSALFLITKREEKYKAQAAIETFFVRGGDTLCALVVWVGTTFLALSIEKFALVNIVSILVWIILTVLIIREYARKKEKAASNSNNRCR
jgi:ATP:ADP antiporter, AAA family